jgi:hemerythrin-like domain-containing protein
MDVMSDSRDHALVRELIAVHDGLRRERFPAHARVIDRLDAEHVEVARILRAIEHAAGAADAEVAPEVERLAGELLAHLDHEEEQLSPLLAQLERWPM